MNKRKSAFAAQYEPLVTPEKWTGDEKRFALRLTQLLDELHARHAALQKRVAALEGRKE
ncbi:MAG: hypothetical protein IKU70_00060 [Clostridia bacterium]|nr:hypothetical protein [Clostridia bacterium]